MHKSEGWSAAQALGRRAVLEDERSDCGIARETLEWFGYGWSS
jgi:hypothetical protein